MKKLIFTLVLALCSIGSWAEAVTVDRLSYELNQETKEAWVVNNGNNYMSGDVVIPDSITYDNVVYAVTRIDRFAFHGFDNIKSVTIGNAVKSIGESAFYMCYKLETVTIGNSVKSIENYAFANCVRLKSVITNDSLEEIGKSAFSDCSLTTLPIGSSVKSIGDNAFHSCYSVTSLTISKSVESIGKDAFGDCSNLESITVDAENTTYDSRDNCNAIIRTADNAIITGCKNTTFPSTVDCIDDYAFVGCDFTSITIPEFITKINNGVFASCWKLTSVKVGQLVKEICPKTFCYCTALKKISLGKSVTSVGNWAFEGCDSLNEITCYAIEPPIAYKNENLYGTFYDVSDLSAITLIVPMESVEAYKAADVWNEMNIVGVEGLGVEGINDGSTSSPQVKTTKHIEDGQVVIIRSEGSKYTLSGQRME